MTQQQAKKIVRFGQLAKYHELLGATSVMETREVTWSELKTLRDGGLLTAGQWYRITDYQCTTTQENTQSAGHQFDIIVRADSTDTLNENAYAAHHAGDTYFANSKLEAWKLLYCLDNIAWSLKPSATCTFQKTGGSPHDNIGYVGTEERNGTTWHKWDLSQYGMEIYANYFYTASIAAGDAYADTMGQWKKVGTVSNVVTSDAQGKGTITWMKDEFGNECPYDFKNIQFKWTSAITQSGIKANVFYYTFSVATGTNDATVTDHSLNGFYCYNNRIEKWITNSIQKLNFNVFRNTSTTNNCYSNTFGNNCDYNTFVNNCYSNTFVNGCSSNTFLKDYSRYIIIEDGNKYISITSTKTTSSSNILQNFTVAQGVNNTTTRKTISHNTVNDTFQTIYKPVNSVEVSI